ncbi:MAG: metal ABC transporter permease [Alphaproteobacteria bacterium]
MYVYIAAPLEFDFMQRALLISTLIGLVCSIFSCFLVLKGWSLMGDAVSHAVLPGLALAYIAGLPLSIGAFFSGLLCAITTGYIKHNSRIKEDALMGIIFSGMFAFGLVLLTHIHTDIHLLHILFGNVLGITRSDMIESGIIATACIAIMVLKRKDFVLYCFDDVQVRALGLPASRLHYSLLILLALTIVSALKATGIILVIAMLIAPGATGFLIAKSFDRMLLTAITTSLLSSISGTILSYHIDASTAPLIVLIQTGLFMLALIINKVKRRTAKRKFKQNHTQKA